MGQNPKMQSPTTVQQTSVGVRQSPTVRFSSPTKFENCQISPNQGQSDFEKSVSDSIFYKKVRQKRKMVRQLSRTLFSPTESDSESDRTELSPIGLRRTPSESKRGKSCVGLLSESVGVRSESVGVRRSPKVVRRTSDRVRRTEGHFVHLPTNLMYNLITGNSIINLL